MPARWHKRDEGAVLAYSAATAPDPTGSYAAGSTIRCRYVWMDTTEVLQGAEVQKTNVKIHIPLGTTIVNQDRFRLTKRRGATLSPAEDYEIVGQPRETMADIILSCRLNTGTVS